MGRVILLTGGARSGKSAMAQKMADGRQNVAYIATCRPTDEEMQERVALHKAGRPPFWTTYEEPCEPERVMRGTRHDVYILDCVTLWLTNLVLGALDGEEQPGRERRRSIQRMALERVDSLLAAARRQEGDLVVVTNEVGLGIVPANALARFFRDVQGRANQVLAREADQVILMVSGLPIEVKGRDTT